MRKTCVSTVAAIAAFSLTSATFASTVVVGGNTWQNAYTGTDRNGNAIYPDAGTDVTAYSPPFGDIGNGSAVLADGAITLATDAAHPSRAFQYLNGTAFQPVDTATPAYVEFRGKLDALADGSNFGSEVFVSGPGGGVDLILGGNTNPGNPGIYGLNVAGDIYQYTPVDVYTYHTYRLTLNSTPGTFSLSVDGVAAITNQAIPVAYTVPSIYFGDGSGAVLGTGTYDYIAFNSAGAPTAVPEPCSIAALGLAGVGLLRRRRR